MNEYEDAKIIDHENGRFFVSRDGVLLSCIPVDGIKKLVLPEGIKEVGSFFIKYSLSIEEIEIPEGVTILRTSAFSGFHCLRHVKLPSTLHTIGDWAFFRCMLESVTIPASVRRIGRTAFPYVYDFVHVEEGNTHYRDIDGVLYDSELTTLITCPGRSLECSIPDTVRVIGSFAFMACKKLSELKLPEKLEAIEERAFGASGLKEVVIPDNVEKMGMCILEQCAEIKSVTLPPQLICGLKMPLTNGTKPLRLVISGWFTLHLKNPAKWNTVRALNEIYSLIIEKGTFPKEIACEYKIPAALQIYKDSGSECAREYIRRSITKVIKYLLDDSCFTEEEAAQLLSPLLESREFITRANADKFITLALESKRTELYEMLLRYKSENYGFEISDRSFKI